MRGRVLLLSALCSLGCAAALAQGPVAEAPDAAALNPLATLDKSGLTGFRDMPLFTPSRKRPSPPVVEPEPEPEPEPQPVKAEPPPPSEPEMKLTGVIEGPEGAVAVVQREGETERLRLGDQVDGWLVTSIEGYELKLTLDEREAAYRLFERPESSGDASSAPPSSADQGEDVDPDDPDDPAPKVAPSARNGTARPHPSDEPEGARPKPRRPQGGPRNNPNGGGNNAGGQGR